MLNDAEKKLIQSSWRLVVPIKETAADLFYRRLFELKPAYQQLFKGDLAAQKKKLIAMLGFIVKSLDWPDSAWRDTVADMMAQPRVSTKFGNVFPADAGW